VGIEASNASRAHRANIPGGCRLRFALFCPLTGGAVPIALTERDVRHYKGMSDKVQQKYYPNIPSI